MSRDCVNIVPLHDDERFAAPAATPELVYNGGPLLAAVEVVTVFWGTWWESADGAALARRLNAFFDFALTSELLDQLAEYDAGGFSIEHGRRVATVTLTDAEPAATVADAEIQQLLNGHVGSGALPSADASTLYFMYLPPNVTVDLGGSRSCDAFCGYHDATSAQLVYAVMPYPGCTGCVGGLDVFDALTSTSSHELCEAITDPVPGTGWYDETNGEIGDICAWRTRELGGYTVQLEWSNAHRACV